MNGPTEHIQKAANDHELIGAIGKLYTRLDQRILELEVLCGQCGKCCRFGEFGQQLLVSTAEAGYFLAWLRRQPWSVRQTVTKASRDAGDVCPFLDGQSCRMREARPLGCRIFFCQAKGPKRAKMQEIYERYHKRVGQVHEQTHLSYRYLPWAQALAAAGQALNPGRAQADTIDGCTTAAKGL